MATNQTHHDIRHALTTQIASMLTEKANLATAVARNTALGSPTVGDGGAAATGELGLAADALSELLDPGAGDVDFDGLTPVVGTLPATGTVGTPINIGVGGTNPTSFTVNVAHLLPFPLVELDPVGAGSNINITAYCTFSWAKTSFPGISGVTPSVCTVKIQNVGTTVASGQYTLRFTNPLDAAAAVGVSAPAYFIAA